MRNFKKIFLLLLVFAGMISCKKEHLPDNTTGTPVFYFDGTVNGTSTSLNAGVNNYYMYSSYTQDTNHVYNFIGNLKQTNSVFNSLEIQLNDYKISSLNATTQPDSSFTAGNYLYYSVGVTDTVYNVKFSSSYTNGTAQTYTWNFGDGTSSNVANPIHAYSNLGIYHVCLSITGASCSNSICNDVNVVYSSSNMLSKNVNLTSSSALDSIYFTATTSGISPFKYNLNFGDTNTIISYNSSNNVFSVWHNYNATGLYPVTLMVIDSIHGDTIQTSYNAATQYYLNCVTNFMVDTMYKTVTTGSSLRLSDVIIKWTDASGVTYTTNNNAPQPSGSYFTVISEEAYQNNASNQATRKLHVKFSCTLYNGTNSIQITNADAVIAMAYK